MKRPQRHLTIIMTVLLAVYLLLTRLPPAAGLALLGALVVYVLGVAIWGRDLLLGRRHSKKKNYAQAVERYERFEKKLVSSGWPRLAVVLYPNIYSFDGIAVTRNYIGQDLLKAKHLDRAVVWLRAALQHDPFYPVPYVNLALIAAARRDPNTAKREMTKAVQLGFDPTSAQRLLQKALDENEIE
jgi:tetratricopeptide (TPR) repeat protein